MSKKENTADSLNNNKETDATDINGEDNILPLAEIPVEDSSNFIKEIEEQKEKYIRLLAEFENYKRRTSRERIDLFKTAGQDLIKDLLPVMDDALRAENVIKEATDVDALKEGLQLINDKLRTILEQKGLKEMDCKGSDFDSDFMEAITELPSPEEMKGKVVEVIEKGYTLNDKIIRHAKVIIGK